MTGGAIGERLMIAGPVGALEAIVEDPGTIDARFGLICHPHPLHGGTMDNKVVTTTAKAMRGAGIAALRFNFRGVGRSAGTFDDGRGETEDAAAAAAWCAARWPGRQPIIAGFSFGAYVALRLARRLPPQRLILIAPAVGRFDFSGLEPPQVPWTVIQGDADEVVDPHAVAAWSQGLEHKPRMRIMPGAGHFFHGRLPDLRDAVLDAIRGD
jgi:hypothetical protein